MAGLIASRLPATLELVALAATIAVLLGGALAVVGTRFAGRAGEVAVDAVTGFILAVPDFLWGLAFIVLFGVFLPLLPISGRNDPTRALGLATDFTLTESFRAPALGRHRRRARRTWRCRRWRWRCRSRR